MKISRREFLAFPALVPAAALGKNGAVAPSDRVVTACIGTGWQGGNNVKSILEEPGAQLVAVCDIDANHLKEALETVNAKYGNKDCVAYRYYEEVLERKDIDAVVLSVPDHWHGILSVAAARAGKDIYGEKPLAHNFTEGVAIRDVVARYGRVWQTGSWQRSVSQFRFACELVLNGRIGKVSRAEVGLPGGLLDWDKTAALDKPGPPPPELDWERWLGPAPWAPYCPARVHKTWRWNLDYGGGMLMDWIGHHIDIAHWGLGLDNSGPVEVEATGEFENVNSVWNAPAKFRVFAKYAGGVTMQVSGGYQDIKLGTKWIGDEGWIWVDRAGIDAHPKSLLTSKLRPSEIHLERSPGHHRQFLECVKTRRRTLTPADVALRSATPGYLGLISILLGRKIAWDPVNEKIVNDAEAERMLSRPMRSPWRI
ncbi:MAG: Gfo/Idh/MocA family protein [Rhodospirillales bacterium]